MSEYKWEKFLWINLIGDTRDIKKSVVELNFAHDTDPHMVVDILRSALKEVRKGIPIDHTNEDTSEKSFLWINLIWDENSKSHCTLELKIQHGSSQHIIIGVLETAFRQAKSTLVN